MARGVWVVLVLLIGGFARGWTASARMNRSRLIFPDYPPPSTEDEGEEDSGELKTFQEVEAKVRGLVDDVIKKLLPYVIRSSADIRLSGQCMASIFKLVIGMQKLQEWAIKMIDATGKPPSGVFQGTSMSLGDFDECINVRVGRRDKIPFTEEEEFFHGKYCTVECKLPRGILDALDEYESVPDHNRSNTPLGKSKTVFSLLLKYGQYIKVAAFRFGVCMPSTCGVDDLSSIVTTVTKQIGFPMSVLHCQEKEKLVLKTYQIIIMCTLALIILLVLACTGADMFRHKVPAEISSKPYVSRFLKMSDNLSAVKTTHKLFNIDEDDHPFPLLRGLFLFTVVCNILGHTYLMYNHLFFFKYSSVVNYFEYLQQFSFTLIANGSIGLENYFFIAGFLITYARWRIPLKIPCIKFSELIAKPYFRMTFAQFLVISLFLLLPLVGYGPFWDDFVGPYLKSCEQRWWINMLYIQNYWSSDDSCLYHTWLLAVVMQLYVITTVILWFLIRKPNIGIGLMIAVVIFGMAAVGAIVFIKKLPGALSMYLLDGVSGPEMWNSVSIQTFDHVGPFCIGLLTGYCLAKHQERFKLRTVTVVVFWCVSVASMLAVICGLYEYRYGNVKMNSSASILYAMLNRNVYSLFLAWFTIACVTGNAGFIPKLMSWKAFIPAYKLSFLAYLLHLIIIYYHIGILRERVYMSHAENIINYFGYLMSTFILAYVCYIFFQVPYMYAESVMVQRFFGKDNTELPAIEDTKIRGNENTINASFEVRQQIAKSSVFPLSIAKPSGTKNTREKY